ncbi:MAG TPA: hypothetical protein DCZ40_10470 [Lachnospiraceae bacterium]|nr:hypothetical protein [Lachnospiraceae bacterium]
MELNGFYIGSKKMLEENFLPFRRVWENLEAGLYQECIRTFPDGDMLTEEILDMAGWLLNGRTQQPIEMRQLEKYRRFAKSNGEQIDRLEYEAKNEKQKGLLYLCVLMHVHAGCRCMEKETEEFISRLLKEKEVLVGEADRAGEPDVYRQQCGVARGKLYHLDGEGRIVSPCDGEVLPMAKELRNICSFAYTDKLGLIAVDRDGKVQAKGGQAFIEIPSGKKIVSVSAYLSNYMLLGEEGEVYTNIDMDLSEWTDLRYIYVGLNSAAGIKKWSGNVVTVGIGKAGEFTDAARICTYRSRAEHYIVLFVNGEARDDEGEVYGNVTAVTLAEDGYYYAVRDGRIYRRRYGEKSTLYMQAKYPVSQLLSEQGKLYIL